MALDCFLNHNFVSGQEVNDKVLITAVMGSVQYHQLCAAVLAYYDLLSEFKEIPNTRFLTAILKNIQLEKRITKLEGKDVVVLSNEQVMLYPQEVFCPFNHKTRQITKTSRTHAIHHFQGSWKQ